MRKKLRRDLKNIRDAIALRLVMKGVPIDHALVEAGQRVAEKESRMLAKKAGKKKVIGAGSLNRQDKARKLGCKKDCEALYVGFERSVLKVMLDAANRLGISVKVETKTARDQDGEEYRKFVIGVFRDQNPQSLMIWTPLTGEWTEPYTHRSGCFLRYKDVLARVKAKPRIGFDAAQV